MPGSSPSSRPSSRTPPPARWSWLGGFAPARWSPAPRPAPGTDAPTPASAAPSSEAVMGATASTVAGREWTAEQSQAITRRQGDLLLDAAAGSGKTSVLVERFAASVLQDGLDVSAILTITFTEKAAAEMRE